MKAIDGQTGSHDQQTKQNDAVKETRYTSKVSISAFSIASEDDHSIEIEHDVTWEQIIGGCVGNVLEWYDFGVFGFVTSELSKTFFPQERSTAKVC